MVHLWDSKDAKTQYNSPSSSSPFEGDSKNYKDIHIITWEDTYKGTAFELLTKEGNIELEVQYKEETPHKLNIMWNANINFFYLKNAPSSINFKHMDYSDTRG